MTSVVLFRQSSVSVRDSWPCYLLTLDPLPEGKDGVRHLNLMEMMVQGDDLG